RDGYMILSPSRSRVAAPTDRAPSSCHPLVGDGHSGIEQIDPQELLERIPGGEDVAGVADQREAIVQVLYVPDGDTPLLIRGRGDLAGSVDLRGTQVDGRHGSWGHGWASPRD